MFDYRAWLERAAAFVQTVKRLPGTVTTEGSIRSPLSDAAVDLLAKGSRLPIPDSLRHFWTTATSHCDLRFHWSSIPDRFRHQVDLASEDRFHDYLWGGPEFMSAEEVVELSHELPSWAEGWRPDYPKDARIWENSLALVPVGNGDYVGLYLRDDCTDPPVVYMCHEHRQPAPRPPLLAQNPCRAASSCNRSLSCP